MKKEGKSISKSAYVTNKTKNIKSDKLTGRIVIGSEIPNLLKNRPLKIRFK